MQSTRVTNKVKLVLRFQNMASEYIWEQCKKQNQVSERPLYSHFTCAKDSENIHRVFDMVIDTVVMQNLQRTSIH